MSSARQKAVACTNGKNSRGAVTLEGRTRSAANATRRGLAAPDHTARSVCLNNENQTDSIHLEKALIAEHAPATDTEHLIVQEDGCRALAPATYARK